MKPSELIGDALDWAVDKALNLNTPYNSWGQVGKVPAYSTDWAIGGPIIEREGVSLEYALDPEKWCACIMADQEVYGQTALIAAMRCYVESKLGDEIWVPPDLQGELI